MAPAVPGILLPPKGQPGLQDIREFPALEKQWDHFSSLLCLPFLIFEVPKFPARDVNPAQAYPNRESSWVISNQTR